ncbi:MAG TPA: EamA family transporter RarD [Acidimicrobiales bacterium]
MEQAARAEHERRSGVLAGVGAYSIWGLFPLVFHQLRGVNAWEILFHRVIWSFLVVVAVLAVKKQWGFVRILRAEPRKLAQVAAAAFFIAVNWLLYIWAVNHDRVVEAALGYYINPLITVALGVVVLHERLRRPQVVALSLGGLAVVVLTIAYGRLPWVSLVLAGSFAAYGYLKKAISVGAAPSLAVETAVLLPIALVGMAVLATTGDLAIGSSDLPRTLLLVSLGVVTSVPLLLFAAAARRIPLSLLGLLQYLTPTLQLLCGVVVFGEPLPPERLAGLVLVWLALVVLAVDALRGRLPWTSPIQVDQEPAHGPVNTARSEAR